MRNLLIGFSIIEIACSALLLFVCMFLHTHKTAKYENRIKLAIILIASVVVLLGLTLNLDENTLSTPGAGIFELIILYILHTVYLTDFEPRRKQKDET